LFSFPPQHLTLLVVINDASTLFLLLDRFPCTAIRLNANPPKLKDAVVPPPNWIDLGPSPPLQHIWPRIALPHACFSELECRLYEMSDPKKNMRCGQQNKSQSSSGRIGVLLEAGLMLVRTSGGQNDQTLAKAGPEANLDTQFGLGMSFPSPRMFHSTRGSPLFVLDAHDSGLERALWRCARHIFPL
jgi:hypothetical protein